MTMHATYERVFMSKGAHGRVDVVLWLRDEAGRPVTLTLDLAGHRFEDFCYDLSRTKPPAMSYRRVADEPADEYEPTLRDA